MRKLKYLTGIVFVLLALQACSFRSAQLDLVRSMWEQDQQEAELEGLAWNMFWAGESYRLYPVISDDGLISTFTLLDGSTFVAFYISLQEWQVLRATGALLPEGQIVDIQRTDAGLSYSSNQGLNVIHRCTEFSSVMEGTTTIWLQECSSADESYSNEIRINEGGFVSLLRFKVHPDYPQVSLTPNSLPN